MSGVVNIDGIKIIESKVFLSYSWLIVHSLISEKAINHWKERNIGDRHYEGNRAFINYDTIPEPSRKKLPSKEAIYKAYNDVHTTFKKVACTEQAYKILQMAQMKFAQYRDIYTEKGFTTGKATEYARKHAVWVRIVQIHINREFPLFAIHEAYKRIYPDGFAYNRMNYAINKCKVEGIPALLIKQTTGNNEKFDVRQQEFVIRIMSSGKAYSAVTIHDRLCESCDLNTWPKPSYEWVKTFVQKNKPLVNKGRYGESFYTSKKAPYAGIIKAIHTHDQWLIDGWRLPFYMEGFKTLNLVAVIDASSGYIIDYDISSIENTESILRALQMAVTKAQCLPYEIVSDNHAFNKTKEAEYFKKFAEQFCLTWTVDSNPRRKSIIERRLGVLGSKFLKEYPGYIGQGIKTKDPDGLTSQEEKDKYQKSGTWRTDGEIAWYVSESVAAYNKYVSKKKRVSPEQLYNREEQPNRNNIEVENILQLFIRESEYKVQRGQINITREGVTHEFQLNAEMYTKYNDSTLKVRYVDFDEIYIYTNDTDEFIGCIKPKRMMHGALANQTESDVRGFNQHAGRLKGIENKKRQEIDKFLSVDPDLVISLQ